MTARLTKLNQIAAAILTAHIVFLPLAAEQLSTAERVQDEIIVSALRLKTNSIETGTSVSIITAEEIAQRGYVYALDAIASAPGVTVNQNSSYGGQTSIRIRGAATEQTLVLINNVVVNDPSSPGGGYNFATLDTASIERIEILKGPQSTLWGTDAIGGVINIVTKQVKTGTSASLFTEAGSHNSIRAGGAFGGANNQGDFRLGLAYVDTSGISAADKADGNSEKDGYQSLSLDARAGIIFSSSRLEVDLKYVDSENEFDGFVFQNGNFAFQDADEEGKVKELSGNLHYSFALFGERLSNDLQFGYSEIDRRNFSNGNAAFSAKGERLLMRYQGDLQISESTQMAFGLEREEIETGDGKTSINGYFGVVRFQPVSTLALTVGGRLDDHEDFGSEATAKLGLAYNPNQNLTLRASWGEGFKAPSLFQTTFFCCGATAANSDIAPEESEAFDLGLEYRLSDGMGGLSLTYFHQNTTNQIDFSFAVGGYENIARVKSRGIELGAYYNFSPAWQLSLSYAHIDAENGSGDKLDRVPENTADIALSWSHSDRFSTNLLLRYNDEEQDFAGTAKEWWRVDLSATFRISPNIEFYGRLENLLDEQYQQVLSFGTPGLSANLGVRWRM